MNTPFPAVFRADIAHAHQRLRKVTEQQATQPFREGAWLRKELLGHLIDSAVHNHVRFLAAAHGELTAAPYDQQSCVSLHGYEELPWDAVLEHWVSQNELLARVVERLPETAYEATCRFVDGRTMTLQALMEDYLRHLNHHLEQLVPSRS